MNPDIREQIRAAVSAFSSVDIEFIPFFIDRDFHAIRELFFMEMSHKRNQKPYLPSWEMLEDAMHNELVDALIEKPGALKRLQNKVFQACDALP